MLVLDDTGVGNLALGVVDHGNALVVLFVVRLGFKAQAAVLQRAQLKDVECSDGAAADRLDGEAGLGGNQSLFSMPQCTLRPLSILATILVYRITV